MNTIDRKLPVNILLKQGTFDTVALVKDTLHRFSLFLGSEAVAWIKCSGQMNKLFVFIG